MPDGTPHDQTEVACGDELAAIPRYSRKRTRAFCKSLGIPGRFSIAGVPHIVSIVARETAFPTDVPAAHGIYWCSGHEILLRDLSPELMALTFWHELTEAYTWTRGYDCPHETVQGIACLLASVQRGDWKL